MQPVSNQAWPKISYKSGANWLKCVGPSMGAPEKPKPSVPSKSKANEKEKYPWKDPLVRGDVTKVYNLRLSEPIHLKLKWLAKRSPESMHEIAVKAVEAEVRRRIRKETRQGPDTEE